jgi:hypothetical protein
MRTTRAKVAYVISIFVVFEGLLVLLGALDAPVELMVAVGALVMIVMFGALGAFWEFPDEPPRRARNRQS